MEKDRTISDKEGMFNLLVLFPSVLASAVSLSSLFPYVGFMVVDIGAAENEDQAGYSSGMIASGMMAGRCLSSVPWGRFADRFGRKPALISGCISIICFSIMFGVSKSLLTAVLARFLQGLFNPIWGIAKVLVSEVVPSHMEAKAMGMVTACWSLGLVLGSVFGGLLANPCDLYPALKHVTLFDTYPYLLPNLATGLVALIGAICVALYLPETLQKDNTLRDLDSSQGDIKNGANVTELLKVRGVVAGIVAYFLLSFVSITYDETIILWSISSRDNGGLEMSQVYIGRLMSGAGILLLAFSVWLYPRIADRLGNVLGFRYGQFAFIPIVAVLTLLPLVPTYLYVVKYIIFLTLYTCGKGCCTLAFSSLGLVVNQLVDRSKRGSLNGLIMATGSVSKTFGPFTGAWLYAWSISAAAKSIPFVDYHFIFGILVMFAFGAAMVPLPIELSVNNSEEGFELSKVSYKRVDVEEKIDDDYRDDSNDIEA